MTKEEISFNLNNSVITKACGIGACIWPMLYSAPFLIVHPNAKNFIMLLLPAFFAFDFYTKLKDQNTKNAKIIKDYKIKKYVSPVPLSTISGLIGSGTLTFLLQTASTPNRLNIFLTLWSALFLIPPVIKLKKLTEYNKEQINKIR